MIPHDAPILLDDETERRMTDLKKLAATMRAWNDGKIAADVSTWADQLDALAAQQGEKSVAINPEEWPAIREAIERLIQECKE